LMTWLPSVRVESFLLIGAGVILLSVIASVYAKRFSHIPV
jgi:MFS transporter